MRSDPDDRRIALIILAAGTSSRLGRPKQLLLLDGRPLLQHVVDAARESAVGDIVVVLGHAADEVRRSIHLPPGTRVVRNPEYEKGQASSLQAGLRSLGPEVAAAIVLLADVPRVSPAAIRELTGVFRREGGVILRGAYGGSPGHPVLLARRAWPAALELEGDAGARALMLDHPEWTRDVELGTAPPADVDTWGDYERLIGRA